VAQAVLAVAREGEDEDAAALLQGAHLAAADGGGGGGGGVAWEGRLPASRLGVGGL
jgi:hypothetical protein